MIWQTTFIREELLKWLWPCFSGMVLILWTGLFLCFVLFVCFFNRLLTGHPGQARCQPASWVLRPSVWGPNLAGEMCGRFCLIRSSKQALIKKQLLTSPLRHRPHKCTRRYKHTETKKQTCCGNKSHTNTSVMVVAEDKGQFSIWPTPTSEHHPLHTWLVTKFRCRNVSK